MGGGFARAAGYYQRHANEGIIRKIQTFLAGRGYDVGDLDGKFGSRTYNAIRQYQKDEGLLADGMWGEDTNQRHRVLGAGETTFTGSRSGAHPGTHTFTRNYKGFRYDDGSTGHVPTLGEIGKAQQYAISNYDWFTGNTADAEKWRAFFRDSKDPRIKAMYDEILDSYTPGQRRAIPYRQLAADRQSEDFNNRITEGTNAAAPAVASALTAPIILGDAITAPLVTGLTLGGAYIGGRLGGAAGRNVGSDISRHIYDEQGNLIGYANMNDNLATDRNGRQIPVVVPDYSNTGEGIGEAVGATLGGLAGNWMGNNASVSLRPQDYSNGIKLTPKPVEEIAKPIKPEGTKPKRKYTKTENYRPSGGPRKLPDGTYKSSKVGAVYTVETPADLYIEPNGTIKYGDK